MGQTKHEKSFVDFDKPYEQNVIGLKGVFYFGIGLVILIVVTFGLMWAFLNVLAENAQEEKRSNTPMMMSEKERLPPEPRIQGAPGFGVESPNGRMNLELKAPQSEYWELRKQWEETWVAGQKDAATGMTVTMPIEMAKEKFLAQAVKAKSGAEAEKAAKQSQMYFTDASSGRMAAEKRR
ncbi:MAG: hypothetical protein H7070_01215 [Saprospiraceae bacterium]|nr:hypothetical protein [Pyrinomonadaceae bacterium]